MNNDRILLRHYDWKEGVWVSDGEVSAYAVAKSITPQNMAYLLDNYVNQMGNEYTGTAIGRLLKQSHRTLQRSAIVFCANLIMALGEQDLQWTDLRNHDAIVFAKKVTELVETIGYGGYV
jgi:hypothetical protein